MTNRELHDVAPLQFPLRALLLVVSILGPLLVVLSIAGIPPGSAAIIICFYAILLGVAAALRRPMACAFAWPIIRLVAVVPFAVAAAVVGGESGAVIFLAGFWVDFPVLLLVERLEDFFGPAIGSHQRLAGMVVFILACLVWYCGGGYLVGFWAQRHFGKRGAE